MRPNASGTTRANTSLTIGSLNDRKIFVTRSSAGSITCGTIRKRSKAYFVLFFNSPVELLMRVYIALLGSLFFYNGLQGFLTPSRWNNQIGNIAQSLLFMLWSLVFL